jgi:uncharacterized protein YdaU (DUF1376 family)
VAGKKNDAWIPFYTGDYLRDTTRLPTLAHGAYILLLIDYWTTGEPLPDNDGELAAITRMSLKDWLKMRPTLARLPYFSVSDGVWRQKRADEEIAKRNGISTDRSSAGKIGAERRWGNKSDDAEMANAKGKPLASAMNGHKQSDAQSQSQSQEEESDGKPSSPVAKRRDDVAEAFAKYNALAQEIGLPAAAALSKPRKAAIRKRLEEHGGMEAWDRALDSIRYSPHCRGENNRGWRANLDFIIQASSFIKLIEGVYGRDGGPAQTASDLFGGKPKEDDATVAWRLKIGAFKRSGYWSPNDGPKPGQQDCEAPAWLVDEIINAGERL